MRRLLWAVLAALPVMAMAETPLSGAEFEAFSTGKTLTYARDGEVWGREQYLPGQRVIWAFEGRECKRGQWHEDAPGLICFVYEDDPADRECWQFFLREGALLAWSEKEPDGLPLAAVAETSDGMLCPGPDVGA